MRRALTSLSAFASLTLLAAALAHAHLDASDPAHGASVSGPVEAVTLRFSEAVEVGFSTFKVFRLDEAVAALGAAAHDHGQAEDHDHADDGHDHGPAADLDPAVLAQAEAVAVAAMADPGFATGQVPAIADPGSGAHDELTLVLAEPLSPGTYVVAWRALSVDTHASDGFMVFEVAD